MTNSAALNTNGAEANARVEYSRDGVNWSTTLPAATQGANSVRVRQTDVAGNVSTVTTFTFTFDTTAPVVPVVALTSDTGTSTTDRITRVGTLRVTGETGARFEYSADGVTGWTGAFTPGEGANSIYVRQVDVAGNPSAAAPQFTFTLDTTAPATAPTVALTSDTGTPGDLITRIGTLAVTGLEPGARAEYQRNGATTWTTTFSPVQGANSVNVRQTDVAGNVSPLTTFAFTFDSVAPVAPVVQLVTDTGVSNTDKVTAEGAVRVTNAEGGAVVEYSPNGTTWSSSYTPVAGANTVRARQTDVAGNVSTVTTFTFTLDTVAPTLSTVTLPTAGTYAAGQTLRVTLTFSKAVHVTGSPSLALTFGSAVRNATYLSGSGTTAIVFAYTVAAGDTGLGLLTAVGNSIDLAGGTLKSTAGVDAPTSLTGKLPATLPAVRI
ncbi:MAG: Ig-like domain repeat protein [Planctomycetia bacterium]